MRVLYLLSNYPQSSESYIDAEIRYAQSRGVEIAVWTSVKGYGELLEGVTVYRCPDVHEAIGLFKPDLLHIHYLVTARQVFRSFFANLPITVRAHSFDWSVGLALEIHSHKNVEAIYAFPHFARGFPEGNKVVPMPVAYDAALYDAPFEKPMVHDRVVRLAAGRRMKGLEDFLAVAKRLIPLGDFRMAVSRIVGDERYVDGLADAGMSAGVAVFKDLPRAKAVELIRTSGIYLDTSDPVGHAFGMPISVAEAMAAGAVVIMRESDAAWEYAGGAAVYYKTVEEAAILVSSAIRLGSERASIAASSKDRARLYRNDVVLPRLVDDWERFASRKST